jgi:WhiB family transcriptional regulator, redox-sensing transcriptional regulator
MARVSRVTTRRRHTPPPDTWEDPPERLHQARDRRTWRRDAACRNLGSSLFFAPDDERPPAKRHREAAAKAVCARCPVRMPCALYALATRQPHGVWGGLTEEDRRQPFADERRRPCAPRGRTHPGRL